MLHVCYTAKIRRNIGFRKIEQDNCFIVQLQDGQSRIASGNSSRKFSHECLATLRENSKPNHRNNAPSPQNNYSNCYTRGPVELKTYENCHTTAHISKIPRITSPLSPSPACASRLVPKHSQTESHTHETRITFANGVRFCSCV